jgi:hypothetical protein
MKVIMFGGLIVSATLGFSAFAQTGFQNFGEGSQIVEYPKTAKKRTRINRQANSPQTFDNYSAYRSQYDGAGRGSYGGVYDKDAYQYYSGPYSEYPVNSYPVVRGRPSVDPLQPQTSYPEVLPSAPDISDVPQPAGVPTIQLHQKWEQVEGKPAEPELPKGVNPWGQSLPLEPADAALTRKEALALYSDFHADQIPSHTQFSFSNIAIPEGSRCANSRGVIVGKAAVTCTPCLDEKAILDGQGAPQLGSYDLQSTARNASGTVVYSFTGKSGEIKMTCSNVDPNASLPDMVKGLERAGISLTFKKPQTAQLMLPVENNSQAPSAGK